MIVTDMPVESLVPYARNPRNNTAAIDAVKASIAEFGFRQPIVVDEKMVVVGGCRKQHHGATFAKVGNTMLIVPIRNEYYRAASSLRSLASRMVTSSP